MKVVFLLGSSRSDGNTKKAVDRILYDCKSKVIDLNGLNITPFDYDHKNTEDDFESTVELLIDSKKIVFATPVYWYSMSSQMKTFFDRTSDLITIRKDLGRGLEGKETFLVSTGTEASLPEGFEVPFKRTSEYFNMKYRGHLYLSVKEEWCDETLRKFKDFLYKEDQEDNKSRHAS